MRNLSPWAEPIKLLRRCQTSDSAVCAVIVAQGEPPTLDELNTWLRDQGISERKLPESLIAVDDMPVTAAGKIRKVDLRRDLEEGR